MNGEDPALLVALHRLMSNLEETQATYDATLTPEERALQETCDCGLCAGIRQMREAIADWKREQS